MEQTDSLSFLFILDTIQLSMENLAYPSPEGYAVMSAAQETEAEGFQVKGQPEQLSEILP